MNKNKNKLLISLVLGSSVYLTPVSHALIPTTDFAQLAESIAGNIQIAKQWAEEKILKEAEKQYNNFLTELKIKQADNAAAYQVTDADRARQTIQNQDLLEKIQPAKDACKTITLSVFDEKSICTETAENAATNEALAADHKDFSEKNVGKHKEKQKEIKNELVEACKTLVNGEVEKGKEIDQTLCTDASLLTGNKGNTTYTENEKKASDRIVQLISGAVPEFKMSSKTEDKGVLIEELRKEAVRSLVRASLLEQTNLYKSPGKLFKVPMPSKMQRLELFVSDRKNPNWIKEVSGSRLNKNSPWVMPTELQKRITEIKTHEIDVQLLQYKSLNRITSLLATLVALEVEPVR